MADGEHSIKCPYCDAVVSQRHGGWARTRHPPASLPGSCSVTDPNNRCVPPARRTTSSWAWPREQRDLCPDLGSPSARVTSEATFDPTATVVGADPRSLAEPPNQGRAVVERCGRRDVHPDPGAYGFFMTMLAAQLAKLDALYFQATGHWPERPYLDRVLVAKSRELAEALLERDDF